MEDLKPLKILHIIPNLSKGGAQRLVIDICRTLTNKKENKVKLITLREGNDYSFLTDELDWELINSFVVPSITGKSKIQVIELQRAIDEFKPDIIHTHLFEAEMVLSEINYPNAKYFIHFHDNMIQFQNFNLKTVLSKNRLTNFYEKVKLIGRYRKRKTVFISISKDTMDYLNNVLPTKFQKTNLSNAIDLDRFSPGIINSESVNITIIGSLVDKKGQDLAIRTISELIKREIYVHLNILGEGPNRKKIENLIDELGLKKYISLHGNVDFPEEYLKNSMFYLHTASYEPFGLVLLEAMACGLPVICTDGKGNRDIIIEGENGYLISDRKPELLADKIELLIKDKELYRKISENSISFVAKYDIKSYSEKLLSIYRS